LTDQVYGYLYYILVVKNDFQSTLPPSPDYYKNIFELQYTFFRYFSCVYFFISSSKFNTYVYKHTLYPTQTKYLSLDSPTQQKNSTKCLIVGIKCDNCLSPKKSPRSPLETSFRHIYLHLIFVLEFLCLRKKKL
jgi:hypothetical protein